MREELVRSVNTYSNYNVSNAYDLPEQTSTMVIASFTTKLTGDIEQFIKRLHLGL